MQVIKNELPLHPQSKEKAAVKNRTKTPQDGPFVYRLGRKIFILERGVRLPYGLQNKIKIKKIRISQHGKS
ncbi:hypothetical protein KL86DYS1_10630 [uncultured Dysgonomonas sp.]|uniref:Uncharacterized protein n=1 Tax=uncultured Dysgonomonas sp. TaxID=206096 RepID=A0A212IZC1_9BACT|nr:hypothetical protein KL86DYS1_10630 [uncultured Dysgonomonas sp.]